MLYLIFIVSLGSISFGFAWISLCLSSTSVLIAVFSQDELLAELDELQELELEKSLPEIGGSENIPLPNVPSTSLPSRPGKSLT